MAGHSKWANIKHRKSAVDAKRSKVWSKLSKAIIAPPTKSSSTRATLRTALL